MDPSALTLFERLYRFGQDNDAQITERPKRMLNITNAEHHSRYRAAALEGAVVGALPISRRTQ
jgi:hypothetical protein